ncbi:alpha/beta hydrolase [Alkalicaulis satelles]|uniref:Alpha/beta hydrolase n=1 Tax=Alkalicaulis satelles TaxID=2609175 RepID=A0A5M6ZQV6_9PROT|nr:alpha/beta fold hydrolase [Alkalicaulis satelles]KAA5804661.1 alpha/beta hydrolase [Alkalicaulis satelles]
MTGAPAHAWGRRGAVRVMDRAVHYRRAGPPGAPVVILLHGSPESASAVHEIAALLLQTACVIAPDTPGNGLSAPLDHADSDREDYARQLLAFMDVMGVSRAGLYGFHTGAGTAMAAALAAPQRVSALALDGLAVWTPDERAALLADYCVTYPPVWDGSHLARIWARLEEQLVFFPWHHARLDARMALPPTPMETRLRRLRDWLTAHAHYPAPYRAAFKAKGEDGPDRVSVPTLIGAMGRDPLSAHLDRLGKLAPGVKVERWGDDRAGALASIAGHFSAHPGARADRPDPSDAALLAGLAAPQARPDWAPDDHGGFLLKLWRDVRNEVIASAADQAALDAGLDPHALHARVTAAIQARTGL